jgi:hypothetical protein
MKITDVFNSDCLLLKTSEEEYRSQKLHYSALQSVANKDFYTLNPETKESARAALDNDEAIIAGHAFESCITNPQEFMRKFVVKAHSKPGYTEGQLVDVLLEQNVNLNDSETIYNILVSNDFWKSHTEKKRKEFSVSLTNGIKAYIEQERKTYPEDCKFISSETRNNIITASSHAKERYLKYNCFYFYDVMLTDGKYNIKLDCIEVEKMQHGFKVSIIDFKFKFAKPSEDWVNSFWYYNYWIQPVIYHKVVENALNESFSVNDLFRYVIGSNVRAEIVDMVDVDVMKIPRGGFKPHFLSEGVRSLEDLEKEYWYRVASNQWDRKYIVDDLKIGRVFI